jgi:hypothetical protein
MSADMSIDHTEWPRSFEVKLVQIQLGIDDALRRDLRLSGVAIIQGYLLIACSIGFAPKLALKN